jgi:transcription initiation factor TFIID subunit 1, fungi type
MLHPAYAKPLLPVKELRSHHRPSLKVTLKEPITFARVKASKKKKLKDIDPAGCMKSPKDLSLKDTSKYVLMEYTVFGVKFRKSTHLWFKISEWRA